MSLWGNKKCGIKPRPTVTRIISQPVAKKPLPLPSKTKSSTRPRDTVATTSRSSPSTTSLPRSRTSTPLTSDDKYGSGAFDNSRLQPSQKRSKMQRASPSNQPIWGDSDDDDEPSSSDEVSSNKRQKMEVVQSVDLKRSLCSRKAFANTDSGKLPMIHAADLVAPLSRSNPNPSQGNFTVKLKYPSASQRERYLHNLVKYSKRGTWLMIRF